MHHCTEVSYYKVISKYDNDLNNLEVRVWYKYICMCVYFRQNEKI